MAGLNIFDQYSILEKKINSNQTILVDKQTNKKVLMKQITLTSLQEYKMMIESLDTQKYIRNPYIVALIDYHTIVSNVRNKASQARPIECNQFSEALRSRSPRTQFNHPKQQPQARKQLTQYRILALYEQPDHSLREQIQSRVQTNSHFDEAQIWSILYSTAIGLSHLQKQGICHGCITTEDIFLNEDGMVRIVDPSLSSCAPSRQFVQGYYYSPEMLSIFNKYDSLKQKTLTKSGTQIDMFKCDVFSLTMCILQCCSLQNCSEFYTKKYQYACYDNHNTSYKQNEHIIAAIDTEKLKTKFNSLIGYYSQQLLNLLYFGLAFSKQARFDCIRLEKEISHILGSNPDYIQFRLSLSTQNSKFHQKQLSNFQKIRQRGEIFFAQEWGGEQLQPSRLDQQNKASELYFIQLFQMDQQNYDVNDQLNNYNSLRQNKENDITTMFKPPNIEDKQKQDKQKILRNLEKFLFREQKQTKNEQRQNAIENQRTLLQNSESFGEILRNQQEKSSFISLEGFINMQKNQNKRIGNQANIIYAPKNGIENMSFQQIVGIKKGDIQYTQKEIQIQEQLEKYNLMKKKDVQEQSKAGKQNYDSDNRPNFSISSVKMIESETGKQKQIQLRFQNKQKIQKLTKDSAFNRISSIYHAHQSPKYDKLCGKPTEQVFTDPKLLEMMRIDMERILAKKTNATHF